MSALADIYAAVRLKLDGTGFEAEAEAAGTKAGETVGGSMSKALGSYLKSAAPAAIGTGLGMALGAAAAGAIQLDAAVRQLMASTGLTGEAAVAAGKSLSGMAKDNLQSFDEIGAVMAKVHNDMGLVGEAADEVTQQFLTFATATGQNAAEAVVAFDDILDSWNLTADDALGIMDKLVASTQMYGGTVPELQSALASLSPILQGMGMDLDDGIGLLNLFNDAGVNATGMSRALGTAMKNLKPGESFDTLLGQLAAIPDQAARTQKAIALFGTIAGPKLALAIKPGRDSLEDFILTEDQVIGKTQQAADVLNESFGNRARMAFKEFQVTLAEFGLNMDAVLVAAALFGPKMMTVLGGVIGGVAGQAAKVLAPRIAEMLASLWLTAGGSNVVLGAASEAGVKGGLAYVTGFASKLVTGAALAALSKMIFEGASDALDDAARRKFGDAYVDAIDAEVAGRAGTVGAEVATQFVDGYKSVLAGPEPVLAGKAMGASVLDGYRSQSGALTEAAEFTVRDVRQAIIDGKAGIIAAWSDALNERNTAANAKDQIIINNAQITAARKILEDKRSTAAEKAEARIRLRNLQASNVELLVQQSQYGTRAEQIAKTKALLTSKALLEGLKDKDPEVRQHWIDVKAELQKQLGNLDDKGYVYGVGFTKGFIRGLVADIDDVREQARRLARAARPGKPAEPRAGGGPVTAGRPYIVGEVQPELFVPSMNGTILPSVPSSFDPSVRAASGGVSVSINVSTPVMTPGAAQALADAIAPHVTRWQQARGV